MGVLPSIGKGLVKGNHYTKKNI